MERVGLIFKKTNGDYELVENKKLDVLLPHLYGKEKKTNLRYTFYLTFLVTSLLLFVSYIIFLPQEYLMTISLALFFLLFSVIAFTVEIIGNIRLMIFIRKIIKARARYSELYQEKVK